MGAMVYIAYVMMMIPVCASLLAAVTPIAWCTKRRLKALVFCFFVQLYALFTLTYYVRENPPTMHTAVWPMMVPVSAPRMFAMPSMMWTDAHTCPCVAFKLPIDIVRFPLRLIIGGAVLLERDESAPVGNNNFHCITTMTTLAILEVELPAVVKLSARTRKL
jgi:hypothetical protein